MSADEARLVPVARDSVDRLLALQTFLINVEQALRTAMLEDAACDEGEALSVEPWSEWADDVGAIVGGWQTAGDEHSLRAAAPTPSALGLSYVVFTNPARTRLLRAWVFDADSWRLEVAARDDVSATWGPSEAAGSFVGDLRLLTARAQALGYDGERHFAYPPARHEDDDPRDAYDLGDPKRLAFGDGGRL